NIAATSRSPSITPTRSEPAPAASPEFSAHSHVWHRWPVGVAATNSFHRRRSAISFASIYLFRCLGALQESRAQPVSQYTRAGMARQRRRAFRAMEGRLGAQVLHLGYLTPPAGDG